MMLELFSGSGIMSKTYGRPHITIDNTYKADLKMNLLNPNMEFFKDLKGMIKILWASPPCTSFSVASIGKHWNKDKTPKTEEAYTGLRLVANTFRIIDTVKPDYWFIENPRGMLRNFIKKEGAIRHTITYCQYGEERMKPTDIWTNCKTWKPRPPCKNGDSCHISAPRGSKTGTQGIKGAYNRAILPLQLCQEIKGAVR